MKHSLLKLLAMVTLLAVSAPARAQSNDPSGSPSDDPTEWKDPGGILPKMVIENTNMNEMASFLRTNFKDGIDVIVPASLEAMTISLRLNNVTATETFNAMNQLFSAGQQPVRWQLSMNGKRPTATLTDESPAPTPTPEPATSATKPETIERTVLYIGDVMVDLTESAFMEETMKVLNSNGKRSSGFDYNFHQATQLLVVSGTPDEIKLVRDMIQALEQRATSLKKRQKSPTVEPAKP